MTFLKHAEKYYWFLMLGAIVIGILFPSYLLPYEGFVIYLIMIIMGLLFLKVDIIDVVTHIKKPFLVIYISIINLILLPIITYFIFSNHDPSFKTAVFLLAALPTGVSSAVFTDIMKGRTSLNLTIVIISNLLSILTIPLLFLIFFNTSIEIDALVMFKQLGKIIIIPFIIAKAIKQLIVPKFVEKIQSYLNFKIILLLACIIMLSFAVGSETLITTYKTNISNLIKLFGIFILFQLIGYFSLFWKEKDIKLAVSNSCMIMNTILGIVLAIAFFDLNVLNLIILSLIPWNLMIMFKHLYSKFLP